MTEEISIEEFKKWLETGAPGSKLTVLTGRPGKDEASAKLREAIDQAKAANKIAGFGWDMNRTSYYVTKPHKRRWVHRPYSLISR